jgi:uncharacterized membrane protein (UPF0127 family)
MRFEIIILSIAVIVLLVLILFKRQPVKYTNVKIGDTEIRAEIANTFVKKSKGLMFRKNLSEREGMLFIFDEEGYYSFWMMNMSFPIDIIWIDKEKEIVDIIKDAQPCGLTCSGYRPKEKAMYVLEVNANFTEKHDVKVGSSLKFELSS